MHRLKNLPIARDDRAVAWAVSTEPVDYAAAVAFMEQRAAEIASGNAAELVWLLEHPPLYTAGTSAKHADLLWPDRFPVFKAGRGGQFTYHGPGQRVVYTMLDVKRRTGDVRSFVGLLEAWTIDTLRRVGVTGETRGDRVGVWVSRPGNDADAEGSVIGDAGTEDKVAAIGIRVRKWVSFHGLSINVDPDLRHFEGIVPCGIRDHGVTSLVKLAAAGVGCGSGLSGIDAALETSFKELIGPATRVKAPLSQERLSQERR